MEAKRYLCRSRSSDYVDVWPDGRWEGWTDGEMHEGTGAWDQILGRVFRGESVATELAMLSDAEVDEIRALEGEES